MLDPRRIALADRWRCVAVIAVRRGRRRAAAATTPAAGRPRPRPRPPPTTTRPRRRRRAVGARSPGSPLEDPLVGFRPGARREDRQRRHRPDHARPQAGINEADVVFEEIVEGGITRLVAVFQSELPGPVGPVRSARTTDIDDARPLGRPLLRVVRRQRRRRRGRCTAARSIDVGFDARPPAYSRDRSRRAPHNLFADVDRAVRASRRRDAPPPTRMFPYRDPGREAVAARRAGRAACAIDFGGVAPAPVTYEYDRDGDGWRRGQNGTTHLDDDGRGAGRARATSSSWSPTYRAEPGRRPLARGADGRHRRGLGVHRRARSIGGTWRRDAADQPSPRSPTTPAHPIELTPGKTWVELPSAGVAELRAERRNRLGDPRRPAVRRHGRRHVRSRHDTGTFRVKRGLAEMLKGGVIMDVVDPEQAKIAEDAGAVAVMALERVPSDIRRDGGVARMSDPEMIEGIKAVVTIPVMAKARIGHFVEAQMLEALGVDYVDESEVLTPADEAHHIDKWAFTVPFVCGATNLGEALRRISEGAAHDPLEGRGRHRQRRRGRAPPALDPRRHPQDHPGRLGRALRLGQAAAGARSGSCRSWPRPASCPVPLFCAGGIATPADAALVMQLGAEAVFVGSGIFKSDNPAAPGQGHRRGHHALPRSATSSPRCRAASARPMPGLEIDTLETKLADRGW